MTDNIIEFPSPDAIPDVEHRNRWQRSGGPCLHRRKVVHEGDRKVLCRVCDSELDPFDALNDLAADLERTKRDRKQAKEEADAVEARLADLKAEEKRVKARIRSAEANDAVEVERRRILDALGAAADHIVESDRYDGIAAGHLYAMERVADAIGGQRRGVLHRKIKAARDELDARRRRKKVKVG